MFYKAIKFIKVNIGEDLAGKIADGNPAGVIYSLSLSRCFCHNRSCL